MHRQGFLNTILNCIPLEIETTHTQFSVHFMDTHKHSNPILRLSVNDFNGDTYSSQAKAVVMFTQENHKIK